MTTALLLKITAYDQAEIDVVDAPPLPGGEIDDIPFTWYWTPSRKTFYLAATDGWSTAPGHTPANTHIPAKFEGPFNYERSLFAGIDPLSPGQASLGVLDIIDPDGDLDDIARLVWDGATVDVLRGEPGTDPAGWEHVASLSADSLEYDLEKKTIALRDLGAQLALAPLHDTRYAGTGGYEGDANLKGIVRLIAIGTVFNIPLRLLVASLLIYEASCTSVYAFTEVRDGGAVLAAGSDYATYALLAAASVAAGTYATCKAFGLVKLGGTPEKQVTADIVGDNDTIDGYTRPQTRGQAARRIASGRGKLKLLTAQLDAASFTALDTGQPYSCGWFWDREISKAEALNEVMQGCLGYWYVGLDGLLKVGFIDELPTSAAIALVAPQVGQSLDDGDYRIVGQPRMLTAGAPRQATYLGYRFNYTIQDRDAIVGAVTATNAAIYAQQSKMVSSINNAMAIARPAAPIVTTQSGLALEADALIEGPRQQRVMSKRRERWSVDLEVDPFIDPLGTSYSVEDVERYTFGGERILRAVGTKANTSGENVATWELWG